MTAPVVIIGAGPAGLSCAAALAEAGREVVILDENRQAGGQYFRQLPAAFSADYRRLPHDRKGYAALAQVLARPGVRFLRDTTVWSAVAPHCIAYAGREGSGRIDASAVVLATGAQDLPMPFPGWTLPGVISAGGCLNLVKGQGLVPQGRVVVAGNGPLVLVTAATLIAAGAQVVAVHEAQRAARLLPASMRGLWAAPGILRQALAYRAAMLRAGVPMRFGHMVAEVSGREALESVTVARIGPDGRPDDRRQTLEADILVTGYGLVPGSEPARLFGCRMRFEPSLNGAVPERSGTFETSVAGVYAIGDGAGIGGVKVAIIEGRIAAHAILGQGVPAPLRRDHGRLDRFRRSLNLAYRLASPLNAATPDTIVCRCEALKLAELQSHPRLQTGNLNALKTATRLGMGRCQGRNCLPAAPTLLGLAPDDLATRPRVRPPLRPIPLGQIAADRDARPVPEPDEPQIPQTGETP
ncbi:FAD-dependent oxidoreductase [Paracoccus sp. TOH]|uniref:FAD-dependent oxidoreductase n=1 Tax=Paracoccus sp. TOH TaxID=1263728 RepID=UPI0025AEF11F|nr:FAD-dependent oxidoreductase [Paracoccus sp. TOH]WJS85367.1 FAD-dependent oxidoreductase [Paracoccus sp. TOH]